MQKYSDFVEVSRRVRGLEIIKFRRWLLSLVSRRVRGLEI